MVSSFDQQRSRWDNPSGHRPLWNRYCKPFHFLDCHESLNFTISTCLRAVAGKCCAFFCILHEFEHSFQLVFARAWERREKRWEYWPKRWRWQKRYTWGRLIRLSVARTSCHEPVNFTISIATTGYSATHLLILQVNEPPHNCLFTACLAGRTALLLIWTLTALLLRDENERDSSEEIILKNVCPLEFKVVSLENSNSSEEFLIQRDWMTYFCAPLIVHLYECALVPARTKGSSIITHARWAKSSPAVIHARCETTHTRAMLHGRMYSKNIRVDEEFATVVHLRVWVMFSTSSIPYEQNLRASSALRVAAWRGHYNETGSKQRRLENIANMSDRAISFYGLS